VERLRYLGASALLGVVAAGMYTLPVALGSGAWLLLPWHPRLLVPMVVAVAGAAWLLRPLIRLHGRVQLWLTGTMLALLSASLFAFLFVGIVHSRDDGAFVDVLLEAIEFGAMGLAMCVLTGYVTLPIGVLFVWLLRPLAGAPPAKQGTLE
jgi:hypothetical protein